jgi:hypothetical protein
MRLATNPSLTHFASDTRASRETGEDLTNSHLTYRHLVAEPSPERRPNQFHVINKAGFVGARALTDCNLELGDKQGLAHCT